MAAEYYSSIQDIVMIRLPTKITIVVLIATPYAMQHNRNQNGSVRVL